jgi:uncharacterized membrane protein
MQPLELYVIITDIILIVSVIIFPKIRLHSGQITGFLIENPGSPFVIAFIVLLLTAAVYFNYGMSDFSNELSEIAYFMILIGVVLQALSPYISKWLRTVFKRLLILKKKKQDQ